ncbi:hypothetical protein OAO09_02260 [Candidatus Pelagibacter sp.]|nr:hypothetical protein [Candidatus Pelagibacter sp.]
MIIFNLKKNKVSFIISLFFIVFSILIISLIYYKAEISNNGKLDSYYLKYYITSFIIFIFSVGTLFISPKFKTDLFIVFTLTLLILYTAEALLFYTDYLDRNKLDKIKLNEIKKLNIKFDTRSHYRVFKDLKKNNRNLSIPIVPMQFVKENNQELFPFSGTSNTKTLMCNENGYYATYESDEKGFRNPQNIWQANEFEILIVGSSFAHGACVNEEDTIAGHLRKKYGNTKVINIAYGGNGPLIEYAALSEYLPYISPKKILWFYSEREDLDKFSKELNNRILNKYLSDNQFKQELYNKQKLIDKKTITMQDDLFLNKSSKVSILKLYNIRRITINRIKPEKKNNEISEVKEVKKELLPKFEKIFQLIQKKLEYKNIKMYFIYLPSYERISNSLEKDLNYKEYESVKEIIKKLNIPIIDINKDLFEDNLDPLSLFPLRSDGHFNEIGYRLISEVIMRKIENF